MKKTKERKVDLDDAYMSVSHPRINDKGDEDPDVARLGRGHKTFPFDLPLELHVFRLYKDAKKLYEYPRDVKELAGWTLQVDAFTFGVKVFIRIGRDGTLKVFAEDSDGMVKLEEWKDG